MAWERSYKIIVKDLNRSQIWQLWQDVNNWHVWDLDLEYARLEADFATGNKFILKPKGGPKVPIKLLNVEKNKSFTDFTTFPGAKMYGIHEMQETGAGLEITATIRMEGPLTLLWRKIVAEKVAAGLEEQTRSLLQCARQRNI